VFIKVLVVVCALVLLLFALLIHIIVFYKRKEKHRLLKEYRKSWNVVKKQAETFRTTNAVQDFRKLQEFVRADLALYEKVQKAIPGYENTDEYLEVTLDVLLGENDNVN